MSRYKNQYIRSRRWPLILIVLALPLVWTACASIYIRVVDESTITIKALRTTVTYKVTGPVTIPENFVLSNLRGKKVAEGVKIDVKLLPGESVILEDIIDAEGQTVITGELESLDLGAGAGGPSGQVIKIEGSIGSGSSVTWKIPRVFGDVGAQVPIIGHFSISASGDFLRQPDGSRWTIAPSTVKSASYRVIGGPIVWKAPFDTPSGRIEGTGTFEIDGFSIEFIGDPRAISGHGTPDYRNAKGERFDYGFELSFPVRLAAGGGGGDGTTQITGGIRTDTRAQRR